MSERSLVVRGIWYLFVGWWATGLWLTVAWLLNLSIVGLPFGIKMINKVPKVLSLKEPTSSTTNRIVNDSSGSSPSLLIRGVYFLLIGWWASGIWTAIAYVLSLTVIGLPGAIWMYNKLPKVVSLYNY